jgi:hypothetical protein
MTMSITNRFTVLAAAVTLACSAWAQQPQDQYQSDQYQDQAQDAAAQASSSQVDPPTRVARVAYVSGDVSFAPAGESEWSRAQLNRPMVTGDKLYTNNGGRAELQLGASTIQVNQSSNVDFLNLNDQTAQLELTQGSVSLDVRRLRSGEVFEVDTPTIAFVADRVGAYRIDVDPQGHTNVSVRRGSGEAVGEGGKRVRVDEGQSIAFNDSQLGDYQTSEPRRPDDFDSFAAQRDERYEHAAPSRNYVAEDVTGYSDLDDYGTWDNAPEYGHVWYPSHVATDWAPYHNGTWDWVEPWGWTWVDESPWGYAPFHYGRWAYINSRWGWVPGPVDVEPVYAPALVAFVGGGGFGIDISLGGPIGWFPLAPGDVFFPGYYCGPHYFNSVNVSNTVVNNTMVNNYYGAFSSGTVNYSQIAYANRRVPNAMMATSATAFASGRPVASSAIAVNRTALANARVLPRATVAPTRASLVASRGRAMAPPATIANRTVVAANRPAAMPASFAQRQALLRQNPGRPLSTAQTRTLALSARTRAAANVRVAGSTRTAATTTTPAGAAARGNARTMTPPARTTAQTGARAGATTTAPPARVRSADFAHQGKPQTTPRSSVATGTLPNGRAAAQARTQQNAGRNQAPVRSSSFAHAQQQGRTGTATQARGQAKVTTPPPRESATAQTHASANARFERGTAHPATPRESTTAQANASANARFERGTTNHAPVRSSTFATQNRATGEQQRNVATHTARSAETPTQTMHRAPQPAARVSEQQHTQAQYRAPQSTRVTEQPRAQAHVSEQPRAPVQPRETMHAPAAPVAHNAPPSQPRATRSERAPPQQAKRKNEKDQSGGGGR